MLIFLCHYFIVGQAVYGDGIYYYSYVRSLVVDKDLDFRNEFNHHYNWKNNNSLKEDGGDNYVQRTKTGYFPNKYNIGAPLTWIPTFLIAYILSFIVNVFYPISLYGYSDIFQLSVGVSNVIWIFLGLLILYKFLLSSYGAKTSLLTTSSIIFSTSLLYYGAVDVVNSHPSSFLFSVLFLVSWYKNKDNFSWKKGVELGSILGILALIRTQDFIFYFPVLVYSLIKNKKNLHKVVIYLSIIGTSAFIIFIPQLLIWKILYGSPFNNPYFLGGEGFNFLNPHLMQLIFSSKVGILYTSPILLISIYFLFLKWKNLFVFSLLMIILLQFYLISSWSGWSQGESYGVRMLISSYPFLSIGLAEFYKFLIKKTSFMLALLVVAVFSILNMALILVFLLFGQNPTYIEGINSQNIIFERLKNVDKLLHL